MFCRALKLSINFKAQVLNVTGTSKKKKKIKKEKVTWYSFLAPFCNWLNLNYMFKLSFRLHVWALN